MKKNRFYLIFLLLLLPFSITTDSEYNESLEDYDGDGLPDAYELANDNDPYDRNDVSKDADGDGLTIQEEFLLGTSDQNPDTDFDTLPDAWEVEQGRNPLLADYQISTGTESSCALTDNGVVCWGKDNGSLDVPELYNPTAIAVGSTFACALENSKEICWGNNQESLIGKPSLSEGICSIEESGIVCQNDVMFGSPPLIENPAQVSTGESSACALAPDGVTCWGYNINGENDVPALVIDPDGDGYTNQGGVDAFPLDPTRWLEEIASIGDNQDGDLDFVTLGLDTGILINQATVSTLSFTYGNGDSPVSGVKVIMTESDGTITYLTTNSDGQIIITPTANSYTLSASLSEVGEDPITLVDALQIIQYAGELRTLTADQIKAADVNNDGEVDVLDALWIVQHLGELRTLDSSLTFLDANTGQILSNTIFKPGDVPKIQVVRKGDVDQDFVPIEILTPTEANSSCESFRSQLSSSNEFNFCWEEDQTTSGSDYSANINQPIEITFLNEKIAIPEISFAESLYTEYGIILADAPDKAWDNESAYAIYQTIKKIPLREVRDENTDYREYSKWTLTDELLTNDVSVIKDSDGNKIVTVSSIVFANANPRIALVEGKKGIFFSNRLHHALIRFITDNGNDKTKVQKILTERYGVSIDIPDYSTLTVSGESSSRFQDFHPSELVEIINMFEEMPKGMHKIQGLNYLVRRLDGTQSPVYPLAPAIAWDTAGYIEFMESAFKNLSLEYKHRLILHEKAHFLWAKVFNSTIKQDWIELGGWYECSENPEGWCTTKQTEFVSAYAHEKNPNEDMAESISFFLINPDALRSRSLLKYEFIRDKIMQGSIYLSVIQENLTFEVYNLYPDYVFPGKIKRLLISVTGEPNENKTVTVEAQLHALDKNLEGAKWVRMRIFSSADTFFDLYLYPINGGLIDTNLRGTYELSKYAKKGFWQTSQIVLSDQVGNLRMNGANDFGWRMYVNNPQEDLTPPAYIPNSATLKLSQKIIDNQSVNFILAEWQTNEVHPKENQGCYGALNDEDINTYSFEKYSPQIFSGDYKPNYCLLEYPMPYYMPTGKYRLNYIRMFDDAGNETRNYFTIPEGVDGGQWTGGIGVKGQLDEAAAEISIVTTNPDTNPPELDLNNISITATPTNPDNPNGETNVAFTFKVKDDISGYTIGAYKFRDPQGLTSHHYHYSPRRSSIFPTDADLNWFEYTATIVLPEGSAPGTWGVVELTLEDRAGNFKTYSFTEIKQFVVDD